VSKETEKYFYKLDDALRKELESLSKEEKIRVFIYFNEENREKVLSFLKESGCSIIHEYKFRPAVSAEVKVSSIPELISHEDIVKVSLVKRVRALGDRNACS